MKKSILLLFIGVFFGIGLNVLAIDIKIPKTVIINCRKTTNFNKCIDIFKQKQTLRLREKLSEEPSPSTTANTVNTVATPSTPSSATSSISSTSSIQKIETGNTYNTGENKTNTGDTNTQNTVETGVTTTSETNSEIISNLRKSFTDSKVIAALIGAISLITTTVLTVIYGKKK